MSDKTTCYEATLKAQLLLNGSDNCEDAIEVLEAETVCGGQSRYLITLASAYACKGGYNTSTFFADDLPSMAVSSGDGIGSLTTFSTSSSMDDPENESYLALWTAIELLLYADGEIDSTLEPTLARRAEIFGTSAQADINSLLSYLILVELGKYLYYYGNSSATGKKGSGTQVPANGCLVNYDDATAITALDVELLDSCSGVGDGHPDLGATNSLNVERMCEAVVLFNNLMVVFPAATDSFGGDDFGGVDLSGLETALAAVGGDIVDVLNYDNCVDDFDTATDAEIQQYFAAIFETYFK